MNMLQVIHDGAAATVAASPAPLRQRQITPCCPICKADAPLPSQSSGLSYYFMSCETDGCPTYVEGETLAEVSAAWNAKAAQ